MNVNEEWQNLDLFYQTLSSCHGHLLQILQPKGNKLDCVLIALLSNEDSGKPVHMKFLKHIYQHQ